MSAGLGAASWGLDDFEHAPVLLAVGVVYPGRPPGAAECQDRLSLAHRPVIEPPFA